MRLSRFLIVLLALGAGLAIYRAASPYQGFQGEVFVEIPRGTGARGIAERLAGAGVVRGEWDFLAVRLARGGRTLQAGEYRFNKPATPREVFDRIARGDIFYLELLVPEGKNIFDIAAAAEHLGAMKAADFLAAARDPGLIRDLDPRAPTLEGYLFPGTYRLNRHTTPERLCRLMTAKFRDVWEKLNPGANVHDTITLASLVEKESKLAEERPAIASVFTNRLRIGMKLDCDPTTIYAALLDRHYHGTILRADLDSGNPYNTYRHAGLPPGPIANPGMASIRAALNPSDSDALYFVLRPDGSGGHQFSSTIAAHGTAVQEYRRSIHR